MEAPAGLFIRPELSNDYGKITGLNDIAFGRPGEGRLVVLLRRNSEQFNFFSQTQGNLSGSFGENSVVLLNPGLEKVKFRKRSAPKF